MMLLSNKEEIKKVKAELIEEFEKLSKDMVCLYNDNEGGCNCNKCDHAETCGAKDSMKNIDLTIKILKLRHLDINKCL